MWKLGYRVKGIDVSANMISIASKNYEKYGEKLSFEVGVDVNYDVLVISKGTHETSRIKETHKMRFFFKPEIENMLKQSRFELLSCLDCDTLKETSGKNWTAYFVAKKY